MTVQNYISQLPADRQTAVSKLREVVNQNLPKGFEETISYNMIGWVVPHSLYPAGYHCDNSLPLPFLNLASQKNYIALYHMGITANPELENWFREEYPKHNKTKLDMGKSCIRFKKSDQIPYELIGQLVSKLTPADWIALYEQYVRR